jgi:hypothetical protein
VVESDMKLLALFLAPITQRLQVGKVSHGCLQKEKDNQPIGTIVPMVGKKIRPQRW